MNFHERELRKESASRMRSSLRGLLEHEPFFGTLALRMELSMTSEHESISCDGKTLAYNPEWVADQSSAELQYCIARLVLGCALKHHTRREDRDKLIWNTASLAVCGYLLRQSGYSEPVKIARTGLTDVAYEDDTCENIYDRLKDHQERESQSESDDSESDDDQDQQRRADDSALNKAGELLDSVADKDDSESQQIEEKQWDEAVQQAAQLAKSQGHGSGSMFSKLFEESHRNKADWRALLQRYLLDTTQHDYSWSRPNRRFIDSGLYLPSLHSEGMTELTLAIDTSMSVDVEELQSFWSEIKECAHLIRPNTVRIIQCDDSIRSDVRYDSLDLPDEIRIAGYGGTEYAPVFDLIDEDSDKPHVLIYFTDGICWDIVDAPAYPVIWALSDQKTYDVLGRKDEYERRTHQKLTVGAFGECLLLDS